MGFEQRLLTMVGGGAAAAVSSSTSRRVRNDPFGDALLRFTDRNEFQGLGR